MLHTMVLLILHTFRYLAAEAQGSALRGLLPDCNLWGLWIVALTSRIWGQNAA